MNIKEVRTKKREAEDTIKQILNDFQEETGARVDGINAHLNRLTLGIDEHEIYDSTVVAVTIQAAV